MLIVGFAGRDNGTRGRVGTYDAEDGRLIGSLQLPKPILPTTEWISPKRRPFLKVNQRQVRLAINADESNVEHTLALRMIRYADESCQ